MNTARYIDRCSAADANRSGKNADFSLAFSAWKIPTTTDRELRSPAEMRRLLNRRIVEQDGKCSLRSEDFADYSDIVLDHRHPKGMGGAWRDNHPENIQAVHW